MTSKNNLSAADYRREAEKHQAAFKNMFGSFIKTGIVLLAVFVVFIFATVAWFMNNSAIKSNGISIVTSNEDYLLASKVVGELPDYGVQEKLLDALNYQKADLITVDGEQYAGTAGNAIQWLMNAESHFENDTRTESMEEGLQPGTEGMLTFYIIPQKSGTQYINLHFSMEAFKQVTYYKNQENAGTVGVSDGVISFYEEARNLTGHLNGKYNNIRAIKNTDDALLQLLAGHLYFFLSCSNNDGEEIYSEWQRPAVNIINGTVEFTYSTVLPAFTEVDQPLEYTIYWVWPNMLGQVLLKNGNQFLGGRKQIFEQQCQEEIASDMMERPAYYFGDADIPSNYAQVVYENSYSGESINRTKYGELNSAYNASDQYIGLNAQYIVLTLIAD